MINPTYGDLRVKVENDLDLQEEVFVTPSELIGYCNAGIRAAAAEINAIYEDYFLTKVFMPLSVGQADYNLKDVAPNCYANKIRKLVYADGTKIYNIKRIKSSTKFEERAVINLYGTADYYRHLIRNDSAATGAIIELVPPSKETSTNHVTLWYLREIAPVTQDSDPVDVPEFQDFVMQFMKHEVWSKEMNGHPPESVVNALTFERNLMVDTLTNMVPDDDDEIEKDLSIYEDMV